MMHTFNLRQADLYEFKVSLVYTAGSRTAKAVPVLKKQNQNQNNQKSTDFLKGLKIYIFAKGRRGNEAKRCLPVPRPCCIITWGFQSYNNGFGGHF